MFFSFVLVIDLVLFFFLLFLVLLFLLLLVDLLLFFSLLVILFFLDLFLFIFLGFVLVLYLVVINGNEIIGDSEVNNKNLVFFIFFFCKLLLKIKDLFYMSYK